MRCAWWIALASCYAPHIPAGASCDPQHPSCPRDQQCVESAGAFTCSDEAGVEAGPDAAIDALAVDCTGWTARLFEPCSIPVPTGGLVLEVAGVYDYDTTTGTLLDPAGGASSPPSQVIASGRVLSVEALALGASSTLRVHGAFALVVASWTTIAIDGLLDASSDGVVAGAGADPAECVAHAPGAGGSANPGSGGGGGGGFHGAGARGGGGALAGPGFGGSSIGMPLLSGGCAGSRGGDGQQAGGEGGHGGGAVQLVARQALAISGGINAGGAGGEGAHSNGSSANGGGGGGGSGGMIGLESPTIVIAASALIAANGGGGGEGAAKLEGGCGQAGQLAATAAAGGTGGDSSDGGAGSTKTTLGGAVGATSFANGGGGGGGGGGYIAITSAASPTIAGTISPPATLVPP